MRRWTIITNYGLVLAYIAKHPESTVREIAPAITLTEWTVFKIIAELELEGYIERKKVGRKNIYSIDPSRSLRHETVRHVLVGDFLKLLGWEPEKSAAEKAPAPRTSRKPIPITTRAAPRLSETS